MLGIGINISKYIAAKKGTGVLDLYNSDIYYAVSLRNLSDFYSGPVVRVRRETDYVEQDFTSTEITDGTLATFCSGSYGFVVTWYDQSSNSNHLNQVNAADQPELVDSSGVVQVIDGDPGIRFTGSSRAGYLNATTGSNITTSSQYIVARPNVALPFDPQGDTGTAGTTGESYITSASYNNPPSMGYGVSFGTNYIKVWQHSAGLLSPLTVWGAGVGTNTAVLGVVFDSNKQARIRLKTSVGGDANHIGIASSRTPPFRLSRVVGYTPPSYGEFDGWAKEIIIYKDQEHNQDDTQSIILDNITAHYF